MRTVIVGLLVVAAGLAQARQPPDPCVFTRWIFAGNASDAPFSAGDVSYGRDVIILTPDTRPTAELEQVCQPRQVRLRRRQDGTHRVKVKWRDCLLGRVKWVGAIDAGCTQMNGVMVAKKAGVRGPFRFLPTRCGDYVLDRLAGEECDRGPQGATDTYGHCLNPLLDHCTADCRCVF